VRDLQLGYLGFSSTELSQTAAFFSEVLGVELLEGGHQGARLRLDDRVWRFSVEEGQANDVTYVGFDVPDLETLRQLGERLESLGHTVEEGSDELVEDRGVTRLLTVTDPDGLPVELAYGPRSSAGRPYVSPIGARFVTGKLGVGHVVLSTKDLPGCLRFYCEGLGFRVTDFADIPADTGEVRQVTFLRCNPRHHSLALVPADLPRRLRHIMVELASVDDVGRLYDRALEAGAVVRGIGRHTNDGMLSFYAHAPGDIEIEIGCEGRLIDDNEWTISRYGGRPSSWGHQVVRGREIQIEERKASS